jgi:Protein of unknown function (DUF2845)
MKPTLCLILVVLSVTATQIPSYALQSDSLFCDRGTVSIGQTAAEVISKCGQPTSTSQYEQKIADGLYPATGIITTAVIDDWTSNFGPGRFQYRLLFKDGRVTQIESLDYGY